MTTPFHPFSAEHGITLLVGAAITALLIGCGRRGGGLRRAATAILVTANLATQPLTLAAWWSVGEPLSFDNSLPFHLCDIAAITAALALITRRRLFGTLTYFWGLAGTLQGLLTPAIDIGFPSPPFLVFFLQHFAIVATALYLPIVTGWRPRAPYWRAISEIFAWSIAYLVFAFAMNALTGANYGFASRPPSTPSLLDYLGPWPWYLLSMQGIALVLFSLLYLPFLRSRKSDAPCPPSENPTPS
ncbi:MAG TPA: TIGR02206 family membrane protein [Bacteroidia bacterium]|nr:TIGR02206 family membrane protein [Bacteroidia bacterium]